MDRPLRVWDLETGKAIRGFGKDKGISSGFGEFGQDGNVVAAVSPDGQRMATPDMVKEGDALTRRIIIRDTNTGIISATLLGHQDAVLSIAFTHGGSRIVAGVRDGTTRLWDIESGALMMTLPFGARCVAVSPDGVNILCGLPDSSIRFWNSIVMLRHGGYWATSLRLPPLRYRRIIIVLLLVPKTVP
jgi:WD40 repeat protein